MDGQLHPSALRCLGDTTPFLYFHQGIPKNLGSSGSQVQSSWANNTVVITAVNKAQASEKFNRDE